MLSGIAKSGIIRFDFRNDFILSLSCGKWRNQAELSESQWYLIVIGAHKLKISRKIFWAGTTTRQDRQKD